MFSINVHLEYANNRALMICILFLQTKIIFQQSPFRDSGGGRILSLQQHPFNFP